MVEVERIFSYVVIRKGSEVCELTFQTPRGEWQPMNNSSPLQLWIVLAEPGRYAQQKQHTSTSSPGRFPGNLVTPDMRHGPLVTTLWRVFAPSKNARPLRFAARGGLQAIPRKAPPFAPSIGSCEFPSKATPIGRPRKKCSLSFSVADALLSRSVG